jgi:hypothetical protein
VRGSGGSARKGDVRDRCVAARVLICDDRVLDVRASTNVASRLSKFWCMAQAASTKRVATAVRFPEELHRQLQDHAEMRDVSVNWLVTRADEQFLSGLPSRQIVEATLKRA